jgi:hypothetical protein
LDALSNDTSSDAIMRRNAKSLRPESEVLKLLDASDANAQNSDSWPDFPLVNAEVKDSSGRMVSVLTASYANLLTLTGIPSVKSAKSQKRISKLTLLPVSNCIDSRKDPQFKEPTDPTILIQNVKLYAFGSVGDKGQIEIWAAGAAGWYTIKPSPAYEEIYEDMVEAVKAWYTTLDTTQNVKNAKRKPLDALDLIRRYAMGIHLKLPLAEAIYKKHAAFIYANMTVDKEGIGWAQTQPIYGYLKDYLVLFLPSR